MTNIVLFIVKGLHKNFLPTPLRIFFFFLCKALHVDVNLRCPLSGNTDGLVKTTRFSALK